MSVNEVKLKKAEVAFDVKGTESEYSRTYCIGDEDHTLGNALRHILMQHEGINFAGYSVPHPSEPVVQIRVQTDGQNKATDALIEAAETLGETCDFLLEELERAIPDVKEDNVRRAAILRELEEDDDAGSEVDEMDYDYGEDE